jgi:D-alanyl-D-alanine dipeptidase
VDLTLADAEGRALDLGSPIDEISDRSYPDHFATEQSEPGRTFHIRRRWLGQAMGAAGFERHPREWWHFSYGDQLWAFQKKRPVAFYGGVVQAADPDSPTVG